MLKGKGASKLVRMLRGKIPVEVGALRPDPAVVIRLGTAEGKTFRGGGAVFTVTTDRTEADGRMKLALTCTLTGLDGPGRARGPSGQPEDLCNCAVLDDRGMPVRFASGSSGGDGRGTLSFSIPV